MGMGSAELRGPSAWLGAWEFGLADIAKMADCKSWLEVGERWPALHATITKLDDERAAQSGQPVVRQRWTRRAVQAEPKQQKVLTQPVQDRLQCVWLAQL